MLTISDIAELCGVKKASTVDRIGERFDAKVAPEPNTGCWLWTASVNARGYGHFRIGKTVQQAHRVAWWLLRGPIPAGLNVLHHCDVPPCVNPDHLFLGDQAANRADAARKGRLPVKLTADEVLQIKDAPGLQREVASRFGVSQTHVSRIKRGLHWVHLEETQ